MAPIRKYAPGELDQAVRELYPDGGAPAVLERLPQYTKHSVYKRAQALGVTRKRRFTEEQIAEIRRRYPSEGAPPLARDFDRDEAAIWEIASRLGLGRKYRQLDEASVASIKRRLSSGEPQANLAAAFNVSRSTIAMIHTGKSWKHVEPEHE